MQVCYSTASVKKLHVNRLTCNYVILKLWQNFYQLKFDLCLFHMKLCLLISKKVRRFLVGGLNIQTQGTMAQLTKRKRFQRLFKLSEGDVWLPRLLARLFYSIGLAVAKRQSVMQLMLWSSNIHLIVLISIPNNFTSCFIFHSSLACYWYEQLQPISMCYKCMSLVSTVNWCCKDGPTEGAARSESVTAAGLIHWQHLVLPAACCDIQWPGQVCFSRYLLYYINVANLPELF